jgi:hypothetical protein
MDIRVRLAIAVVYILILQVLYGVDSFSIGKFTHSRKSYGISMKATTSSSVFDSITQSFNDLFNAKPAMKESAVKVVDERVEKLKAVNEFISSNKTLLLAASLKQVKDTSQVVDTLLSLEKLMRERNKLDEGITSQETINSLDGSWRLIFTTGTVDTQKKLGRRVNYFPLKAIQSFNTTSGEISNGIFLGDFPLIKFFGDFEWLEKPRKLEFDFDRIQFLGIKINLPKAGAAKIGQSTGLGSENNIKLVNENRKPFFNWISADENIATARGGGGGLALWRRDSLVL